MGLIKAAMGAVGGVLGDQWKEFFYCESMPPEVLVTKGMKRTSSQGRSSNTSAEDNIISNGSVVAVNDVPANSRRFSFGSGFLHSSPQPSRQML